MRYSRQEILIGKKNQELLQRKTVAIIGVGAIGTVSAELLARAGVNLILIDRDVVELNNLQRQTLFSEKDVGQPKAIVAKKKLKEINSEIKLADICEDLNKDNISILKNADLILDCTDNFETRFLINDFCKREKKDWIYSAGIRTTGTVMNFFPYAHCFRCVFKPVKAGETCETVGVLGSATAIAASIQVSNAIKILTGKEAGSEMIRFDLLQNDFQKIEVHKKKDCPSCAGNYEYLSGKKGSKIVKLCGKNMYQIRREINFGSVRKKLEKKFKVKGTNEFISFKDISLFKDGRALIRAKSEREAKTIYSKFIGN